MYKCYRPSLITKIMYLYSITPLLHVYINNTIIKFNMNIPHFVIIVLRKIILRKLSLSFYSPALGERLSWTERNKTTKL